MANTVYECKPWYVLWYSELVRRMDRRRFEDAHLKYAVLKVTGRYSECLKAPEFSSDIYATLQVVTPAFYNAFQRKYSGTYELFLHAPPCISSQ